MPEQSLSTDPLLANVPVHKDYKVLGGVVLYEKLGQGGMGAVYKGRHLRLDIDVALKVTAPPPAMPADETESFIQRFVREARTAAAVKHANLIRVYDVDTQGKNHFLIMDYVDGESAGERLKRKGRLSEAEAFEICLNAAEGLAAAHMAGIVHRDVKPDNILLDKKGNVVIADLGLAKAFGGAKDSALSMGLSQTHQAMGTPYYMSPEQTLSAKDVGPAADVWSLGITLYQLLTDALPYPDTDIADLIRKIRTEQPVDIKTHRPEIGDGARAIIEKALHKDLGGRYVNCNDMADALRDYLDSIRSSSKSVLPDEEAGSTRFALIAMDPPPPDTLTFIGASLVSANDLHSARTLPPSEATQETMPQATPPASASREQSAKWLPLALTSVVGLIVILALLLGGGGDGNQSKPEDTPTPADLPRPTGKTPFAGLPDIPDTPKGKTPPAVDVEARVAGILRLARTYRETGRKNKALDKAAEALDIAPEHPAVKQFLREVSREIAAGKGTTAGENEFKRWMDEGLRLRLAGKRKEAAKAYERAQFSAPPGNRQAELAAAECLAEDFTSQAMAAETRNDFAAAVELYALALARKDDQATRLRLVTARSKLEELKAEEAKRKAAAGKRSAYDMAMKRAAQLEEQARWKDAIATYEEALRLRPGDVRAKLLLAEAKKRIVGAEGLVLDLGNGMGLRLAVVPAGEFVMGSPDNEAGSSRYEKPQRRVKITRAFGIGKFEVTQSQYERVMGTNPSKFKDPNRPVEQISWDSAVEFCQKASRVTGKKVRLPTEAEWEYACRAGTMTPFHHGHALSSAIENVSYSGTYGRAPRGPKRRETTPVGSFLPNAWGLHDMHGNVREWVGDRYANYSQSAVIDPPGPTRGRYRVVRGGSFVNAGTGCRSASRHGTDPRSRDKAVGFRVAVTLD